MKNLPPLFVLLAVLPAITETSAGFLGACGWIPDQYATMAEVLRDSGWSTFWLGKNHDEPFEALVHVVLPRSQPRPASQPG